MHDGGYVYAYSHISRDQASAVQHFWEFTRLYMTHRGINPKGTRLLRRLTDALVLRDTYWHEWNRLLFMNDIEIVDLAWFRGAQYADYFRFLDSTGGFWLHRWGDHAIRTLAVAMFLDESRLMKMDVPYGHQNTCRCSSFHADKKCARQPGEWWVCSPGEPDAKLDVPGEEGTIKEDLVFGGE